MSHSSDAEHETRAQRWERAQNLFHTAAELPASQWRAFLEQSCDGDESLVREVLELLEDDALEVAILDGGIEQAAQRILESADDELLPTQHFGAWRVTRRIGEGGMGVVYQATRDDLGNVAAIKVLRDAWLSPARRRRFADEQRTLARLLHPSIARLYDAGALSDGTPWFVMEFVEGDTLSEYCRSTNCDLQQRLALFRAVCEAVRHAHQHLVIHRDLKPSNILVTRDGAVKLVDFGIAKQLETLGSDDVTRTGLRLMTPAYAAPEQVRGDGIGVHTDVYSLGVILYELLTGRVPFDVAGHTPAEAAAMITTQDAERPSLVASRAAGAPLAAASATSQGDLDVLCLTAMEKSPERRYQSVEALIRDIDHFRAGEPLEARAPSLQYRAAKFIRRNARDVALTAIALFALIAMASAYTVRLTRARNDAVAEAARSQRIQRFMLSLFNAGDAMAAPAESLRVLELLDRGVREAGALRAEPAVQGELLETLGSVYMQLGELTRADSLLTTSLAQRRSVLAPDSPDIARGMVALGLLRDAQAEYAPAESLVRVALTSSKRTLPPRHPAIARATIALGRVLENRGDYSAAIPILEDAVSRFAALGDTTADLAEALTELANCHFYEGRYAVSDSINRQVLALDRALHGEKHPNVGDDLINLGAVQFEWGHLAEAERYNREAVEIFRTWYGEDNPQTASSLTILARTLISLKRLDEAHTLVTRALGINERVYGAVHPRVASSLNELGRIAQQQGKLDEAERYFTRMADVYKQVYNDKHYLIGVALSNLAGVRQDKGDNAGAERIFREVLRRYAVILAPDHQLVAIAKIRLGRAVLRQGRAADAERETRAGYELMRKQAQPNPTWIRLARIDLSAEYDSLGRKDEAERIKRELADTASAGAAIK